MTKLRCIPVETAEMTFQEIIEEAQQLSWQEQFHLAARLLQWAEAKMEAQTVQAITERQPDLHPGAFVVRDDFDAPLPDTFWLGEE